MTPETRTGFLRGLRDALERVYYLRDRTIPYSPEWRALDCAAKAVISRIQLFRRDELCDIPYCEGECAKEHPEYNAEANGIADAIRAERKDER